MSLKFCTLASGSSGNSTLVFSEQAAILIDAGVSGKKIFTGAKEAGFTPDMLDAVLVTHEHQDHIKSIRTVAKKAQNAAIVGTEGTLLECEDLLPGERTLKIRHELDLSIGDIRVEPFGLSHDAREPIGFSFISGGRKLSIITDTGVITENIYEHLRDSDALILEANHEVNILQYGPYPYYLKRRILSDHGHLSNETAGEVIARVLEDRRGENSSIGKSLQVMLAHLSNTNNTPGQAFLTVRNVLFEHELYPGKDVKLAVAPRDEAGLIVEV